MSANPTWHGGRSRDASRMLAVGLALALLARSGAAQQSPAPTQASQNARSGFQTRTFQDAAGSHKYSIFIPAGYTPQKKWPVILFLHGAGERGADGVLPTSIGLGPLVKAREANFPFLAVFPQNDDLRGRILAGWAPEARAGRRALAILAQVESEFNVDPNRRILTGWSMGGYGVWQLAAADPARWSAIVPISGGGDPALAEKLKSVPVWAVHGAKDNIVRPESTRRLVEAVRAAGGNVRYTEAADGDHNVWRQAYDDDRLYAWMLSPASDPDTLRPVTSRPRNAAGVADTAIPESPFVPALDVERAVHVRLGNDMLAALADAIPRIVPRESLTGWLNDISDYTSAEGYDFSVYMSGLSYSGQLARAHVKAYRQDRLNVQLALSNVQVNIGGTSIQGDSHSASAGPMAVVIGHVRPVWLSFDVTPAVVDRQLKLRLVAASFQIPNDNWYVSGPRGVSARGFGLTREKVSNGLVSGLYGRKATIEQQVVSVVPRLIAEMERRLDMTQLNQSVVGSLWPLPVYQPRLRLWPADVSTDEQGVTLVLGVTAAAVDPSRPPAQVRVVTTDGPRAADAPRTTELRVGVSPQLLAPLTELLVDADVARIHTADTTSPSLARLSDAAVVAEIIPDLKRFGDRLQVATELALAGPIQVVDHPTASGSGNSSGTGPVEARDGAPSATGGASVRPASANSGNTGRFSFEVPRMKVLVSIRTDPAAEEWTPCAEFDLSLRQGAAASLLRPTELTRAVALEWEDQAVIEVTGRFAEGYEPHDATLDADRLKSQFAAGWDEYVHGGPPAQLPLPDLDLGYTRLRALDAGWASPSLFATFGPPGVKLTNSSDQPLVYETKGPHSNWGGPYTLAPGKSHDFPIAYPMLIRRTSDARQLMFTLPVGSHTEYRLVPPATQPALYQAREPAEIERARQAEQARRAAEEPAIPPADAVPPPATPED